MKSLTLIFFVFFAGTLYADTPENLESTMWSIATDLSALHNQIEKIRYQNQEKIPPSRSIDIVGLLPEIGFEDIKITNSGYIYSGADLNAAPVKEVKQGDKLQFVDKAPGWYAVLFDNSSDDVVAGWVPATHAVPEPDYTIAKNLVEGEQEIEQKGALSDILYKMIVESVTSVKKKYENNPHVVVNGFSVDIGVPPELSIQFEFK